MPSTTFTSGNRTYSKFNNFGEYLFYCNANLQMLCYAVGVGKRKYDRMCYMIRSKAFKAYKEGEWSVHDLLENNLAKIRQFTTKHLRYEFQKRCVYSCIDTDFSAIHNPNLCV